MDFEAILEKRSEAAPWKRKGEGSPLQYPGVALRGRAHDNIVIQGCGDGKQNGVW